MRRSDFLALIPSLSAIPFIGKDIIKKSDRIEIFQPEQMESEIKGYDEECQLQIVKNGRVLASGFITSVNVTWPILETTCRDNNSARTFIQGARECEITGIISGPITTDAMEAMHNVSNFSMRTIGRI